MGDGCELHAVYAIRVCSLTCVYTCVCNLHILTAPPPPHPPFLRLLTLPCPSAALSVKRRPGTDSGSEVDDSVYECLLKNQLHRTSTSFSLQIQEASSSAINKNRSKDRQVGRKSQLQDDKAESTAVCRYEPMSNTQVLPKYLHKAIDCEPSMVCLVC